MSLPFHDDDGDGCRRQRAVYDRGMEKPANPRLIWVSTGVLPLLLFAGVMLVFFTHHQRRTIEQLLREAASGAAHAVERVIGEQVGLLSGLAASRSLDQDDLSTFRLDALRLWDMHSEWRTIILTNENQPILNLRFQPGEPLPPLRDPASLARVWMSKAPLVGDLVNDHVAFRIPVIRDQRMKYTIAVPTRREFFGEVLRKYPWPQAWSAVIVAGDDTVIAATPGADVIRGERLPQPFRSLPDDRLLSLNARYATFAPIAVSGWRVLVLAPAAFVDQPFLRARVAAYVGGLLAVTLTVGFIVILSSIWATRREANHLRGEIAARTELERSLRESQQRLHLAQEAARAGTWEWDLRTNENRWSDELWALYGLEPHSCAPSYEAWRQTVHPEDRPNIEQTVQDAAREGIPLDAEWRVVLPDGSERWLMSRGQPMHDGQDQILSYLGIVMDITERKRAEVALRESLEEKIVLLQEVHHRVKNNLQIVASLLNLQASRSRNPELSDLLGDVRNRVHSMALLHETLYRANNLRSIDFAAYVEDLCAHLRRSFGSVAARVRLTTDVTPIAIELEESVSCGLIINELVSNAFKHGFPGDRTGTIVVTLQRVAADTIALRVQDDGVGLCPEKTGPNTGTLGLQLVSKLAGQLGGGLEIDPISGSGSAFRVVFPILKHKHEDCE